jgi:hypothetical protein
MLQFFATSHYSLVARPAPLLVSNPDTAFNSGIVATCQERDPHCDSERPAKIGYKAIEIFKTYNPRQATIAQP